MKYCVLFPQAKNVHLIKDVGMIAYKLHKLYSVESYVACYNNDRYDYIDGDLKGLKLDFINKKHNNDIIDGSLYLRKNAKTIDVLQLFHVTARSVVYAMVYKHYNRNGKIFLKLDCTENLLNKIKSLSTAGRKFFNYFFKKVDIIGVEQKKLFNEMQLLLPNFKEKFKYIPNGIDYDLFKSRNIKFENKENNILHVGRLGAEEKNSEMLVEAFVKLNEINNDLPWNLILVGESTEAFTQYVENCIRKHPSLRDKIKQTGPISNRKELIDIYAKSKIFCLTSHFESFGIVLIEAAALGNIIVSTNVGIANELVAYNGGSLIEDSNIEDLTNKLSYYISNGDIERLSSNNVNLIQENYDWDKVVMNLYNEITK
ncbi:glycosyltransferase family 4 protein [Clostridium fungisolvens]|uniref:D-inositol-3-phosphate glycosyltransferase n=1 Tax=Clostridium fungisolvens TaxID=1604897 RepID=A0A6V8SHU0_9CLOT|nr:glycosyltransferase family 4 protein [Clostridium fungisolvens]GFP76747.1 D-inositol-3-phosphate glycosyltransferase [Clostridium fungisolvens]